MDLVRTCSRCGANNRIPPRHLAHAGKCGACHAELPAASAPINVDTPSFDCIVRESTVPVLVDFWASWCGPCRMAAPEVHRAAEALSGRAVVLKVDTEKNPDLAARYNVRGIPNFAVFRDGRLVRQQAGLIGHDALQRLVEA